MSNYERKDALYLRAKDEGYVARSAYKLIELDGKFGILKPQVKIFDLGCAPGGWLQVAQKKLKHGNAKIVGIDLLPIQTALLPFVTFIQGDFLASEVQKQAMDALGGPSDWVISDLSPNLTGIPFKDLAASQELCEAVLEFARTSLKKGGGMLLKIFPGPEFGDFKRKVQQSFKQVTQTDLAATRKSSSEIYLIARGYTP